jgi:hypothetical protein
MIKVKRARNLGLIRWMIGGHKQTATKMAHITNTNYISKMINGEKPIPDKIARDIEKTFELPEHWLDRDNEELIKISIESNKLIPSILPGTTDSKIETRRSRNLDMIRWMAGGHSVAAKKILHIINPTYLCKMAMGQMIIPDNVARTVEKAFELPERWLDRDNEKLATISHEDYQLISSKGHSFG